MVIMWVMVMITIMAISYIGIYGDDGVVMVIILMVIMVMAMITIMAIPYIAIMVMIAIYGDDVVEMGMRQQVL